MKKWFVVPIVFLILGFFFKIFDVPGKNISMVIGFVWLGILFIVRLIKTHNKTSLLSIIFLISLILTTFALYTRYLFFSIGDYPSLIIIPLFLLIALVYFLSEKNKPAIFTLSTISYALLIIVIFIPRAEGICLGLFPNKKQENDLPNVNKIEGLSQFNSDEAYKNFNFGVKHSNLEEYSLSKTYLEKANSIEPNNMDILRELSTTYFNLKDVDKAIETITKAIELYPDNEFLYNNRGYFYYHGNKYTKAESDYSQAIRINPKNPIFYRNIVLSYYYSGNNEDVCHYIDKLKELDYNITNDKEIDWIEYSVCD
ncbi:tetratricopeptide repeat protein [Mangrovimonas sp. ST2L15]|uniref:tetratricopeptide repeat protein n=1 Tax=Mangrovimonas sp. ST2L15 TaxID=1645916 RepID=UPI0006B66018|nr:tetratricopeptide repeat protein [Mangrovimonas sp. ST2L15]